MPQPNVVLVLVDDLGQGEVIQLLATGKAVQAQLVLAAWAGLQDPKKSAVAGKLDVLPVPRLADGQHGAVIGNWNFAVPKGAKNKKAALAFGRWFLSQPAQVAYGKAGGIPVRTDVLASDLAKDPMNRWMPAYLEAMKTAKQELGYQEGAQVEAVLGVRENAVDAR